MRTERYLVLLALMLPAAGCCDEHLDHLDKQAEVGRQARARHLRAVRQGPCYDQELYYEACPRKDHRITRIDGNTFCICKDNHDED